MVFKGARNWWHDPPHGVRPLFPQRVPQREGEKDGGKGDGHRRSRPLPLAWSVAVNVVNVAPALELGPFCHRGEPTPCSVPGPADLGEKSYGLAVPSLEELKTKGKVRVPRFSASDEVTVVLEDDGTICCGTVVGLAQQLKQDLASVILMSEAELQILVDAPCSELAAALGFQEKKAEDLQDTLQRVLDRREEERQSKELLQLYLKATEKEERPQEEPSQPSQGGAGDVDMPDGMEVDSASGFMPRTLMVLKGKTSPETRLSTEDLQMVVTRGVEAMEQVLGWSQTKTSALLQACKAELNSRLRQVQAVQSIRGNTQMDSSQQSSETSTEEGNETPAQGSN
ncbi:hypothetical protein INR49_022422 [Caranx melampygus]|nr:hypothetical protein INR49_022422 [Caranx melampygus]